MTIAVDIKRTLLTTITCAVFAVIPLTISTTESFYPFIVPLLFSIAITLTNYDRIVTRKKYQAFLLSAILTLILFFISVPLALFLGQTFLGKYSVYIICVLSGLLVLTMNSIIIRIDTLKFGFLLTGLFALSIPQLTTLLKGQTIFGLDLFGDPATFFIIWQTVIGLGIAISIWTKTNISKENNK
jgi:hypothetical protein